MLIPKPAQTPLSEAAIKARRPCPPADLVGALQDPVHRDIGNSRPAKPLWRVTTDDENS
jgi:hypothetical protein